MSARNAPADPRMPAPAPEPDGAGLTPLTDYSPADLARLQSLAEKRRPLLEPFIETLQVHVAGTMEEEITALCHAFSLGVSKEVRRRRATIAARLAGGQGFGWVDPIATAKAAMTTPEFAQADAGKTYACIGQAAVLGLLPPLPHLRHALDGPAGPRQLLATRFVAEVLQEAVPERQSQRLQDAYRQADPAPDAPG